MKKEKLIVGWREWASLPALNIKKIKVKVDTGARTSALHAMNVKITGKTKKTVHFEINPNQDGGKYIKCSVPLIEERKVKSSNGISSLRPVIKLDFKVGEYTWPIELTLVNRDIMGFRMLLGRQGLRGGFLVDPGKSYVLSSGKIKTSKHKVKPLRKKSI